MATEGKSDDGSEFNAYTMNMDYNLMSSPLNYELAIMNPTGTKLTNFDYLYGTDIQPNAPIKVGDMTYTYDASGNPVTIDGEEVGRSMIYDSDNRLREIMDYRKNIMSRYTYNHAGERAVKRYGAFESMAVNGAPAGSKLDANAKYSAYVSPYYVENGSGTKSGAFSKHYYAGSDRIASKTADDAYFYFTDHLGSTTHITDRSGDVAQYAAYTPYGSLFREYRSVQPYKFNGKELDQETGYYYYGARYYDPTTALWLGTDPLKHEYPDIGAYVYCHGNPINMIDPTGKSDYRINQETGQMDIEVTKATSHSYYLVGENWKSHLVGMYSFNKKGLVQLKSTHFKNAQGSNVGFSVKDGNDSKMYLSADAIGSIIGAVADAGVNDLTVIGGSNADGSSPAPSVSHKNGKNVDLRYLRDDKSGDAVNLSSSDVDVQRQNQLNNSLYKFGWKDMISEYFKGGQLLNHTSSAHDRNIPTDHTTHLHMQGYRPDVIYLGPTLKEVIVTPRR